MINYNYITGEPIPDSPNSIQSDISQYAVNAQDLYRQQALQNNGGYIIPQGPGYIGPTNNSTVTVTSYSVPNNIVNNLKYVPQQPTPPSYYAPPMQQPMIQPPAPNFMNPPLPPNGYTVGIGPQYINNPVQPSANPAIDMIRNWQAQGYQYQPQFNNFVPPPPQDQVVTVPGYNPGGNPMMYLSNTEEICDNMQVEMMLENEAAIAKRERNMQSFFNNNNYGYNYYGMPYVQSSYDQSVTAKYRNKLNQMRQEAVTRRLNFNKNLSRLCHKILQDGVTEEDINKIYGGYSYTIPAAQVQYNAEQEKYARMVPYNNAYLYQEADRRASEFYHLMCPEGQSMNEFFGSWGFMESIDRLEEQYHKRRDAQGFYDQSTFRTYIRKYALENGINATPIMQQGFRNKKEIMEALIGKDQVAEIESKGIKINEDTGHVTISAPEAMKRQILGEDYKERYGEEEQQPIITPRAIVVNENEGEFEKARSLFLQSIYNQEQPTSVDSRGG